MNRREIPKPEYDDPKELYAFFGLAFYNAQVLEQGVVNLAVALNAKGKGNVTVGDVLGLYEDYDGKTFGKVLGAAQQFTTFSPSLEVDLKKVLGYRNYLAHSFFIEHSEDALHGDGRRAMIDELRTILEFLVRVDSEFDPVWMSAWHVLGVTQEWFERKFAEIRQVRDCDVGGGQ
ncbi:MAG: hypothetical protein JW810_04060 [Sedimentisphaerales bacterium]|nr:hypothetical protein [Sedimentisphaerales bacterium]